MHIFARRYAIPFRYGRAISTGEVGNFAPFLSLNWLPWQRPSIYWKNRVVLIIWNSISTIWCKNCENRSSGSWDTSAPNKKVWYETKLVAMATSLEASEKLDLIKKIHALPSICWKDCENWSIDSEIALLILKKRNEKKKKLTQVKYIVCRAG